MHFSFTCGELIDIYYKLDYVYINKYSLSSPIQSCQVFKWKPNSIKWSLIKHVTGNRCYPIPMGGVGYYKVKEA